MTKPKMENSGDEAEVPEPSVFDVFATVKRMRRWLGGKERKGGGGAAGRMLITVIADIKKQ